MTPIIERVPVGEHHCFGLSLHQEKSERGPHDFSFEHISELGMPTGNINSVGPTILFIVVSYSFWLQYVDIYIYE